MNNKEMEVLIKMKADVNMALKKVQDALKKVEDGAGKSNISMTKAFNKAISPATNLIRTFNRVALVAGVTFGAIAKLVSNSRIEMSKLDQESIKLGMTTEQLSKQIYGFNIATKEAKIGASSFMMILQSLKNLSIELGAKISESIGSAAISVRAENLAEEELSKTNANRINFSLMGGGINIPVPFYQYTAAGKDLKERSKATARQQLEKESFQRIFNSEEGREDRQKFVSIIDQLSMGSAALKKKLFYQEIEGLKKKYGEEMDLEKLTTAFANNQAQERTMQMLKLQAQELKAKGNSIAAMKTEDEAALIAFKKIWGEDGEMVDAFKKAQEGELVAAGQVRAEQLLRLQAQELHAKGQTIAALDANDKAALIAFKKIWGEDGEMVDAFTKAQEKMRQASTTMYKTFQDVANALSSSLSENMTSMRNFLQGFRDEVSQIIRKIAAEFAISETLGRIWAPFNLMGLTFHQGGVVKAHNGLAVDEVPIIAQTGERVLSRSQNRDYERMMSGGMNRIQIITRPTVVISAWDAADVKRHEKQISSMVTNAVRNDPQLREAIKKYG